VRRFLPLFTRVRGRRLLGKLLSRIRISPHPQSRVSYTSMGDFHSDLKSILGPRMLWEVVLGIRRNDLLGLAGQLAYFFLLSFFPFLIFLVSLTGVMIGNPEAGLKSLFEALTGLLPANPRPWWSTMLIARCVPQAPARLSSVSLAPCGWARPSPSPSPRRRTTPTASRRAGRSGGCAPRVCS
jgi:Virulence factor BrkB